LLGPYGLLTGGVGGSVDDDAGSGFVGQAAYEYIGRRFNVGARTRYTSSDFARPPATMAGSSASISSTSASMHSISAASASCS
jgi:hypothetical protein